MIFLSASYDKQGLYYYMARAGGMILEEKWEEVLEQYDLKVKRISWARGAKLLETDHGFFQLKQFIGKPRQLALEHAVTSGLVKQGYQLVDHILKTKDGMLFAKGSIRKYGRKSNKQIIEERGNSVREEIEGSNVMLEEKREQSQSDKKEWWQLPFPDNCDIYVIRKWFPGEEVNFRNAEFLKRAAAALGKLHNAMEIVEVPEELAIFHPSMALLETWQKHNRELKRIRRYILNKKQKNEFEILFLSMEGGYFDTARNACHLLEQGNCRQLFLEAAKQQKFCHGSYNYHNLLDSRMGLATVCFENAGIGVPVFDLYQMMRKLLEKNRWEKGLAIDVLREYEKQRRLDKRERELLYIMLLYPEKFWKVSNHYYNSRKSWINKIDIVKLEELGRQQSKRQETLEYLRNY